MYRQRGTAARGQRRWWFTMAVLGSLGACGSQTATAPDLDARLVSVSVGVLHTCGLTPANEAFCWGWGEHGQLGTGGTALLPAGIGPVMVNPRGETVLLDAYLP